MAKDMFTDHFSESLDNATAARIDIDAGDGNLTIDRLAGSEPGLASGELEYFERQGPPARSLALSNGQATLTLKGGSAGHRWFRLPWAACNGATEWQIHLNPTVPLDMTAHSNGGNVKLDLAGLAVTRVAADTGGGNMDVILPDQAADLSVVAKTGAGNVAVDIGHGMTGSSTIEAGSGAGNVEVRIPGDIAARIHVTTGLGKAIVAPRFEPTGKDTYQSSDFDSAANRVEITLKSGAGNVSVDAK